MQQPECDMGEVPPVDMTCPVNSTLNACMPRDPDPMLTSNTVILNHSQPIEKHIGKLNSHAIMFYQTLFAILVK